MRDIPSAVLLTPNLRVPAHVRSRASIEQKLVERYPNIFIYKQGILT
jgi:hypothetical protein